MKIKRFVPVLLSLLLLAGAVYVKAAQPQKSEETTQTAVTVSKPKPHLPKEARGVWVTYMTLDVENEADKKAAFEEKIDTIIGDTKAGGFNTLIVQVRPFCDALYHSAYYPWSHIISGTQGVDPGFDPLGMIIDKCRQNGMYIHAWVNPYRISTENTPAELSSDHPYVRDPSLGVEINGRTYLDPASPKAQQLIADGVRELVENYDIDGVQFDDYFYPENCGDFDKAAYQAYMKKSGKTMSLTRFRMNNVSGMVRMCYQAAHEAKKDILFGISPQGNLKNNDALYADVKTWCAKEGYIDYICPQIYFSLDNPALTYENSLKEWLALEKHRDLRLFIGLPGYKAGTAADNGTWLDNNDILQMEISILRKNNANGFIIYSYDSFHNEDNQAEIQNVIRYLTTSASQ